MRLRIAGLALVSAALVLPSYIKFTQTGSGATSRTLASKLGDDVSVKDFGATGDGVTNDTAAIQTAVTAVGNAPLILPCPGTYHTTTWGDVQCGTTFGQDHTRSISNSPNAQTAIYGSTPLFSANNSKTQARLFITDRDSPDPNGLAALGWGVYPFVIWTQTGNPRPLLSVNGSGGLNVWDYINICPNGTTNTCQPAGGNMLDVGSDLSAAGVNVAIINNANLHDFIWINSWTSTTFDTGTRKFTFGNNGFQNSTARNIVRNSSAPPDCAAATLNLTLVQFLEAAIFTCGTAQTVNFPTWQGVGGIVQSLPGVPHVGDVVQVVGAATGAGAITLGFGTGGTNGNAGHTTIPANSTQTITCRITSVTASAETATCY